MASSDNLRLKHRKIENRDANLLNDVLPEDVVSHILSLLPTKEAIRTCILSKRWRFLWSTISNLDFSDHKEVGRLYMANGGRNVDQCNWYVSHKNFINYVSSVLLRLDPTTSIDKFSITLEVYPDILQIKKWISCAVERNVKDLTLSLTCQNRRNQIYVPREVFDCTSLESLRLYVGIHLKIPKQGFVCFPSLKSLSLEYVSISGIPDEENSPCFPKLVTLRLDSIVYEGKDDCMMKLIRNCPVLEDLSISRLLEHKVSKVDMCIPWLTIMHLDCWSSVGLNVQIEAPIKFLKISYWNPTHKIIVKNPDSLISAELSSYADEGHHFPQEQLGEVLNLLETVDKVKYLLLSTYMINAIKISKIILPLFSNLIRLEVSLNCIDLRMLESFLNSTINLQSLIINKHWRPCRIGEDGRCIEDDRGWAESLHVPKCLISSLKTVEINNAGDCPGELDMIKIMLKSAKVLEKFTTNPGVLNKRDVDSLHRKIRTLPRASAPCRFHIPSYSLNF